MLVLFDLQKEFENIASCAFADAGSLAEFMQPCGIPAPHVSINEYDNVKYMSVEHRKSDTSGLTLTLSAISDLQPGDKICITGRVGENAPLANWGVGLYPEGDNSNHLSQHNAPEGLYNLYHTIGVDEMNRNIVIRTAQWDDSAIVVDFYVDSILITRPQNGNAVIKDERPIAYSLINDAHIKNVKLYRAILEDGSTFLVRSGTSEIKAYEQEYGARSLAVRGRVRDWDAIDVLLKPMGLILGNLYQVRVTGTMGDQVPEGAKMMFHGLPAYAWRSHVPVSPGSDFVLEHILTQSELENWTGIRITTNGVASQSAFIIKSIEVIPMGLV